MNGRNFFERVSELERVRAPFALATVVGRRAPVSSHLGDRAIVLADGRMQGFVGGSCARDIVRRQALAAMRSGTARLVQIRPGAAPDADESCPVGTVIVPMACASEGAVDVYIEPHLPPRVLLVAGSTPVASALSRLGALLDGYRVVRAAQEGEVADVSSEGSSRTIAMAGLREYLDGLDAGERAGLVAVVATQGHYDEAVLEALLARHVPPYVGLLASRRRASEVFDALEERGIERERLERIHNPVGLDIGARRPGDVAVSILAEIVATASAREPQPIHPESLVEGLAADPVCGMDVDIVLSSAQTEHDSRRYYFCSAACRTAFLQDPRRYAMTAHA
jgi:xanthine dehydrogenase accessory factor